MNKLSISNRRDRIIQEVMAGGSISVRDLAEQFHVSTETIRKDLIFLERQNVLRKGHGEATLSSTYLEVPVNQKLLSFASEKCRIADSAKSLIPAGGVVFIDSGSTCLYLAKLLNFMSDLTIVTNSLSAVQALVSTNNQVLLTGGELRSKSLCFVGSWTSNCFESVRADISFLGCDGFHESGPSIRSYREVQIKQLMIEHSSKAVLLCDSSKFSNRGLYSFASFHDFSQLITDSNIDPEQQISLSSKINLVVT